MNMYSNEYAEWLSQLKVGDTVCYDCSSHFSKDKNYVITKIKSISIKTRQITTENGIRFREGTYKGSSRWSSSYHLQPFTEEVKLYIKRCQIVYFLGKVNWGSISLDQLVDIYNIIDKKEEDNVVQD